jgi:hypothetical protein
MNGSSWTGTVRISLVLWRRKRNRYFFPQDFGFHPFSKYPPVRLQIPPAFSPLDHLLELPKRLEGHGERKLHAQGVQQGDDLVAEEGAAYPCLDPHPRQVCTDGSDTGQHELLVATGVMDVSGAMMHIEDLAGLGDRAEQKNSSSSSPFSAC